MGRPWVFDNLVTILEKLEYLLHQLTVDLRPSQDDQRLDTSSRNESEEREKFPKLLLDKILGRSVPIHYFQKLIFLHG